MKLKNPYIKFFLISSIIIFVAVVAASIIKIPYSITEKHTINTPIEVVRNQIIDLRTWKNWSPWIMHEPNTKLKYSENNSQEGSWYEWEGEHIGSGRNTLTKLEPTKIQQELAFTSPMDAIAIATWDINSISSNEQEVSWTLEGKMPLLWSWVLPMMKRSISNSYKVGLRRLHSTINQEAPTFSLEFLPIQKNIKKEGFAITHEGTMESIGPAMQSAYTKIERFLIAQGIQMNTNNIEYGAIYRKADIKENAFTVDNTIFLSEHLQDMKVEKLPANIKKVVLPTQDYFLAQFMGPYDYLEYAWFEIFGHMKMKKIPFDWKKPSLEIYRSSPNVKNPRTDMYLPTK